MISMLPNLSKVINLGLCCVLTYKFCLLFSVGNYLAGGGGSRMKNIDQILLVNVVNLSCV